MSVRRGYRLVARRRWAVGLTGVVLAAAAAAPSGAVAAAPRGIAGGSARTGRPPLGQTPDQVINAQTDPNGAAQALTGCADITKCSLAKLSNPNTPADPSAPPIIDAYGPPSILGDVLYNCANPEGPDAFTAVGVSDTRGETTSVSEKLSVTLQGGLIGIASTSLDAWVSSTQAETFSTTVSTQTQVTVPPGYKGFTTTQVLSAETQASYYVTRGIKLIEVTGIDMSFPGYQDNQTSGDSRVIYNTIATPINPLVPIDPRIPLDNYQSIAPCNSVSDSPSNALGGVRPKAAARSFKLTVCPPSGRCVTHSPPTTAAAEDPPGDRDSHPRRSHVRHRYRHPRAHPDQGATKDRARTVQADHQAKTQEVHRKAEGQAASYGRATRRDQCSRQPVRKHGRSGREAQPSIRKRLHERVKP